MEGEQIPQAGPAWEVRIPADVKKAVAGLEDAAAIEEAARGIVNTQLE